MGWNDKGWQKFLRTLSKRLWANVNNTDMRLELKNGSIYQVVGTDNVDRLVGSNPIGVIFSEFSLQDPRAWDLVRPILAENGGWAVLFIPQEVEITDMIYLIWLLEMTSGSVND